MSCLLSITSLAAGSPPNEPPAPTRPATATTPPSGTWVAEGSIGAGQYWHEETEVADDGDMIDSGYDAEVITDFSAIFPSLSLGVTDRLHVGIVSPGIAYRFGDRGHAEWIPYISSNLGVGYSSIEGAIINLLPRIGLSAVHWLTTTVAIDWTVSGGSILAYRSKTDSEYFERGSFGARVGLVIHIKDRFTVAPSIGIGVPWDRVDKDIAAPSITFLGANPNGLWQHPLFRVHINDFFAIGLNLAGFIRADTSAFGWNGGVDLTALW